MYNKIEDNIDALYEFIESCKSSPLSPNKIMVPKDEFIEKLDELKSCTPEVIKRYQRIIASRENIIQSAEQEAEQIKADAREQAKQLINETEIMQQAYAQANALIQNARAESQKISEDSRNAAEQLRTGILLYANDIMTKSLDMLQSTYDLTKAKTDELIETLREKVTTIAEDRNEIVEQLNSPGFLDQQNEDVHEENYTDADFADNFNGDTFMNNIN